jgi:hypothetical protein
LHFSADERQQLEYAALLHDFGKVGVREKVLVKAKKLYESELFAIDLRFDYIRKCIQADTLKRKLDLVRQCGVAAAARRCDELDDAERAQLGEIDELIAFIHQANEPTVLAESGSARLCEIAARSFVDGDGGAHPYLLPAELEALSVTRGSLTASERREIESHVVHTHKFLANIPWGRRLAEIPRIAVTHHEKLDGSGYPHGLRGNQIGVEARMMTITDIFDALTASDRPYKKAVPLAKALDIIAGEVKEGKCDAELWRIFVAAKVWERVLPS